MVLPIVLGALGAAGAQYMSSESARRDNRRELARIQRMIDGVETPNFAESDYLDPRVAAEIDPRLINYADYEYQGDYTPETAEFAREVDPRLVERSEAANYGRDAQLEALKKFRATVSQGYDPEFDAKIDAARRSSQADAQSRMASILQDAQRRGQMGSGAMLAAQMQGASGAMDRAALESQNAAVESYRNRMQQMRDSASMGQSLARDEEAFAARNADIINSFNQRTSRAYQDYLNRTSDVRNSAQLRNLDARQNISNANTDLGNRQMLDRVNAQVRERDYANRLIGQRHGVRQANFDNDMSKVAQASGTSHQRMQQTTQAAQDRNNAIQGVYQGFAGYYGREAEKENRQKYGYGGYADDDEY